MANKDLRAEHAKLLRFETLIKKAAEDKVRGKTLNKAAILAGFPMLAMASASAAEKLGDEKPMQLVAEVEALARSPLSGEAWLVQLAEAVTKGHNVLESLAESGAFVLLQANGTPKRSTAEFVQSLLMNGLS
ncbi:MAG: hypothetical protein AAFW81_06960 [Pseudomonadota bacterium]